MTRCPRKVAVFGSTGSIGTATLDVIERSAGRLQAEVLSAHSNTSLALRQAQHHRPRWLVITNEQAAAAQDWTELPATTELLTGCQALQKLFDASDGPGRASALTQTAELATASPDSRSASRFLSNTNPLGGHGNGAAITAYPVAAQPPPINIVVAAIVGSAGLESTLAAIAAGKRIGLANKETLVMAGALVMQQAALSGAEIVPVDSEHSAIFQCLRGGRREEVQRVILTASGGPFRRHTLAQLQQVTVEEALCHPNWSMGPKITIDSATMMNKALEIIEARWLFDLRPDQIEVVIHPQSVVHSMVEFCDGSTLAQLGPPDMRLPIQFALEYPERRLGMTQTLDWRSSRSLDFEPPDRERFPAIGLGLDVASAGGGAGAVLNAANEAAVSRFLHGELPFCEIVPLCRRIIDKHPFDSAPTLERLFELDRWARQEVARWKVS